MEKPEISAEKAMYQAEATVQFYFIAAIKMMENCGLEYKKHPGLLGTLVDCQTKDYHDTVLLTGMHRIAEAIETIK